MRISCGKPYPSGATFDGAGVNFSLFSSVATRVELCLFDQHGSETRLDLPETTASRWHGYVFGLRPGQLYGFRVHGPWAPESGHRCDPAKLLLDPYSKSVHGEVRWHEALFAHDFSSPVQSQNHLDSKSFVPRSVVIDPSFDWDGDRPPRTSWDLTVIYETHVKGFTMQHPDVPGHLRGTYLGLAHPAAICHLKTLGVTAIELMPIQHFVHDLHLLERGLRNYWGYNTIGFFAPYAGYANQQGKQVREFQQMVKALHAAGLEVILDVAYGHTAEGNHLGPVLSFKGIDNVAYYRLVEGNPFYYMDYTGTGNSLNTCEPYALQFLMDSLRYWVTEMHVDGFRFDLASTLARGDQEADRCSAFFDVIQQDPIINQIKLIAEPWDLSADGYQLGNFPPMWSEWNGRFRDGIRDYWRGAEGSVTEFAYRFAGSPDIYARDGRRPCSSINFVTCHDGFTLTDLVSYNEKHNEGNGEQNVDGENNNRSWNCGIEGPTLDAVINDLRKRQKRNLITSLLLSQGVPMLLSGDELGRTQWGNNNAYCQDNEMSWLDWEQQDAEFFKFVRKVISLRREHPVFRGHRFYSCDGRSGKNHPGLRWYRHDGEAMQTADWPTCYAKTFGVFLCGLAADDTDDNFYVAFNAHFEPMRFTLPNNLRRTCRVVLHTGTDPLTLEATSDGVHFWAEGRSIVVLTCPMSRPELSAALSRGSSD